MIQQFIQENLIMNHVIDTIRLLAIITSGHHLFTDMSLIQSAHFM